MTRRRKILITVVVLIILVAIVPVIHHFQLRAARNAYLTELKAKGEPIELAMIVPSPTPPEQNSAGTFRKAAELFKTHPTLLTTNYSYGGMKMVAPGEAETITRQPDLRDDTGTNSWREFQVAVGQNKEAFALLHQIIRKPNFDFGVHYEKGIGNLDYTNLNLAGAKAVVMRLGTAVLSDLHEGDAAAATENLRTMIAIANATGAERLEISELVRLALVAISLSDTWEILQASQVTDQQLAALQNDWANLEFFNSMESAFELERASMLITVNEWRGLNSEFSRQLLDSSRITWASVPELSALDRLKIESRVFRWRYWWSYPDEIRLLKAGQLMLEALRAAQTNDALFSIQSELQSNVTILSIPTNEDTYFWFSDPRNVNLHFALSQSIELLPKTFGRVTKIETSRRMVVAAIALKRYHLKHGGFPPNLASLTPDLLSEVPRDPIDGQPLRYRLNADGTFLLYSIGDDGKDNGGDPTPSEGTKSIQWQRGRDWVWPQPASVEEIRKFYENPPK